MDSSPPPLNHDEVEKTSALLKRVLAELPGEDVSVGEVIQRLRSRSFGGMLMVLATLGLLPGISLFAGFAMIFLGLQMASGFQSFLLPGTIQQRQIGVKRLRALGERAIPAVEQIERFTKPRWLWLTPPLMPAIIGILVTALALVVMIPLPFSNFPPAIALLCLSLGLLERDGMMILIGLFCSAIALTIGLVITCAAYEAVTLFLSQ